MSVREPGRAAQHLDAERVSPSSSPHVGRLHRPPGSTRTLLFVPMERSDIRHAHAVLSRMTAAERCRVLHGEYRPGQILDLMKHLDLAVGMRLHFLMFAALAGVPLLALPYAGKVFDFAQRIGAPVPRGVVREAAGPLLAQVDRLWDERPQRLEETASRVAALQAAGHGDRPAPGAQLERTKVAA